MVGFIFLVETLTNHENLTQVRIREFILGNELIKYLRKCDNFLITRHASLYWVLKIIQGKTGHQQTLNKRFNSLAS